jgi:hypothetical protein
MNGTHIRYHFIDELRGIAALGVTLSHLVWLLPYPLPLLEYGMHGVEVFFVISGFVIAYSLRDRQITGRFAVEESSPKLVEILHGSRVYVTQPSLARSSPCSSLVAEPP